MVTIKNKIPYFLVERRVRQYLPDYGGGVLPYYEFVWEPYCIVKEWCFHGVLELMESVRQQHGGDINNQRIRRICVNCARELVAVCFPIQQTECPIFDSSQPCFVVLE